MNRALLLAIGSLLAGFLGGCAVWRESPVQGERTGAKPASWTEWWVRVELEGSRFPGSYRVRIREWSEKRRELAIFPLLGGLIAVANQFPEGWQVRSEGWGGHCRFEGPCGLSLEPTWSRALTALWGFWSGSPPPCRDFVDVALLPWSWVRSSRDPSGETWVSLDQRLEGRIRLLPEGGMGELRDRVSGWRIRWRTGPRNRTSGALAAPERWDPTLPECPIAALP